MSVVLGLCLAIAWNPSVFAQTPPAPTATTVVAPVPAAGSKDIEAIREIAGKAIESARADVEIVKWVFIAFASVGGLFGWFGFKGFTEMKQYYRDEAERDADKIVELRQALSVMLFRQDFVDSSYNLMAARVDRYRRVRSELIAAADAAKPNLEQELGVLSGEIRDTARLVMADLEEMRRLSAKIGQPRWDAYIEGYHGVTLHLSGRHEEAIPHLETACRLSVGEGPWDEFGKTRRASHLYNLACCRAQWGKDDDAALRSLEEALEIAPWRWREARDDDDFERFRTYPRFRKALDLAQAKC